MTLAVIVRGSCETLVVLSQCCLHFPAFLVSKLLISLQTAEGYCRVYLCQDGLIPLIFDTASLPPPPNYHTLVANFEISSFSGELCMAQMDGKMDGWILLLLLLLLLS